MRILPSSLLYVALSIPARLQLPSLLVSYGNLRALVQASNIFYTQQKKETIPQSLAWSCSTADANKIWQRPIWSKVNQQQWTLISTRVFGDNQSRLFMSPVLFCLVGPQLFSLCSRSGEMEEGVKTFGVPDDAVWSFSAEGIQKV